MPRRSTAPAPRISVVVISPAPGIVRVARRAPVAMRSVARPGAVTPAVLVSPGSPSAPGPIPVPISGPGPVAPSVVAFVVAFVVVSPAIAVLVAVVSVSSPPPAGLMVPVPWGTAAAASRGSVCLHGSCEVRWRREKKAARCCWLGVIRRLGFKLQRRGALTRAGSCG